MRLGIHIRIAKGLIPALQTGARLGCETVQFFASNPNAWRFGHTDPVEAKSFAEARAGLNIYPVALHTAYLLNLASRDEKIWARSINSLTLALERANALRADYVVTHIGSHGGAGRDYGVRRVCDAVMKALKDAGGRAVALLESGAGAGNSVGSRFEDLRDITECMPEAGERLGFCLDSAHLYAAGYDVSTREGVHSVMEEFDRLVGLERLKFFHLNDTRKALGSKIDRHWHVGEGNVGIEGFRAIVNHPALAGIAGVVETPGDSIDQDEKNLLRLKGLREE